MLEGGACELVVATEVSPPDAARDAVVETNLVFLKDFAACTCHGR